MWSSSCTAKLSLRGAWDIVRSRSAHLIWHSLMNPKFSFFSWRVLYRRIPTDHWAQKIGVNLSTICSLCNSDDESIGYLFFSCPYAIELWLWILKTASFNSTHFNPCHLWSSLCSGCDKLAKKGMTIVFFSTIYVIWKTRNEVRFSNQLPSQHLSRRLLWIQLNSTLHQLK